ncbi:60Kd inner membrane protein-domain-containing protein [Powellomyces hirtus]|nr:60Kd inner membrane protein-domain-containing protein [Powellomyces hirtus]
MNSWPRAGTILSRTPLWKRPRTWQREPLRRCYDSSRPVTSTSLPWCWGLAADVSNYAAPTAWIDALMTTTHSATGFPWWLTIITCTVAMRAACTFPLAIQQRKRMERLASLTPLLSAWEQTYRQQLMRNRREMSPVAMKNLQYMYKEKASELYKVYNCHPLKTLLLPWVQIPLWVTVSLALRNMASFPAPFLSTPDSPVEGFTTGGTSWFVDLATPDPTLLFPLSIGFLHLINIELNRSMMRRAGRTDNLMLTSFFRSLGILIIPVATQVPMALNLYWATSAAFSVCQNIGFWIKDRNKHTPVAPPEASP